MKTKLLLLTFLITTLPLSAQIIWTGGGGDINWNTPENWSSNTVPTTMDNVEIPSGFTVTIGGAANCQSLELKGSAILNIDTFGSFSSTQPSIFESGTTINWARGTINCSLLVNQGTMNLTSSADKLFETSTLVNNNGTINIIGSGDLFLRDGTVLNNEINGIIDMRADDGDIDNLGGLPILNNEGIIRRSTAMGVAQIKAVEFNNNGGIIQVDSGTLDITGFGDKNFTGGSYVVSSGTVLEWDTNIVVSGVLMGTIEGDLNWVSVVEVPVSATFDFTGNGSFNWIGGILNGGGVLTNEGIINSIGGSKSITEGTTLNNSGTLNLGGTASSNLSISGSSTLSNLVDGTIDIQADGITIQGSSGTINNSGLIRRTTTSGTSGLSFVDLNNTGGTIQVESGTLAFTQGNSKSFNDGTINVSSGAEFNIDSPTPLSGTINGLVDGDLIWESLISVTTSATLSFTGNGNVNSTQNTIDGGGTLINQGSLNITGATVIQGNTTLNNTGTINLVSGSGLNIPEGTLNNEISGVINMQVGSIGQGSGAILSVLNNNGLIRKTLTNTTQNISVDLSNSGTIEVETGELTMAQSASRNFTNTTTGLIKGVGIIDLPSSDNYTNDGTYSPGASPGILTVEGDFESTTNAVLDIELDGLVQGTQYDVLSITGNAEFNGSIQVTINFDADVNDEFIVATTLGTINACNLPASVMASFGSNDYELTVECRNNNELVLTVLSETLSVSEEESFTVEVYPNPVSDLITVTNNAVSRITIFDIKGRNVLETNQKQFSLANLESGVYFLRAESDNNTYAVRKIIKN